MLYNVISHLNRIIIQRMKAYIRRYQLTNHSDVTTRNLKTI